MKKITLKLKCLSLLLFLTSIVSFAQQREKCLTDALAATERQKNPTLFDKNKAELERFTRNYAIKGSRSGGVKAVTTIIPTVIHVIHNGEAVNTYPNMSDVQLISAITNLNDAFKNQGIYANSTFLGNPSYNSPMDIEFVLAKVKEDGSATTGIERHDVTSKSYAALYNTDGISGGTSGVDSAELFKDYIWNPQDYMNIWIVKKIDGVDIGTTGNGTLGYATLPTSNPGVTDGLVCQARAFGYNTSYDPNNPGATPGYDFGTGPTNASGNGTADHEVGHYLNLHHTFNGDADETTCPPLSGTIGTDDDGCADIAPHIRTNSICPAENATVNTCVNQPTGGPNEYIRNFMNYSSDPCFTGFSNDQRTRVHAAIDGPRSAFKTAVGYIAPSGNYPALVTNTPASNDNFYSGGIFEVSINGNTFKSLSNYNDGFYLNRVASQAAITLVQNTLTTMNVTVGSTGGNKELLDVYVDYNNNGTFETSERVHQTLGGFGVAGAVVTVTFATPITVIDNQKLRMRLITGFDNNVNTLSSAHTTDIGNIEDYSVIFNPTLSVANNEINSDEVKIYPNPTNDILNISTASNNELKTISIFDALGRQVFKGLNSDKVSVSNLRNGIYFLKLDFNNSKVVTKRFVKE